MIEFEVNGVAYRAAKMDAFKQFHVARRLAPVLSGLVGLLATVGTPDENAPEGEPQAAQDGDSAVAATKPPVDAIQALTPLAEALANMSDEHADYVLKECLRVVTRGLDGGTGWAPVTLRNGALVDTDMDMGTMLQIAFHVIRDNLSGFFAALPPMSPAGLAGALGSTR